MVMILPGNSREEQERHFSFRGNGTKNVEGKLATTQWAEVKQHPRWAASSVFIRRCRRQRRG